MKCQAFGRYSGPERKRLILVSSGSKPRFPAEVDDLLRVAGWFPGRAVDTTPCSAAWAELGLIGGPTALVREFDGLTVTHPPFVDVGEVRHFDHTGFGAVGAVAGLSSRMYREYSTLAGVDLYPVGEDSLMGILASAPAAIREQCRGA